VGLKGVHLHFAAGVGRRGRLGSAACAGGPFVIGCSGR
jgi:hypothetical protein